MKLLLSLLLLCAPLVAQLQDGPTPQHEAHHARVFDAEFIAAHAAFGAARAADAYTTVNLAPGCIETNRLLGPHPSTERVVVKSVIEFGAAMAFDVISTKFLEHSRWRHIINIIPASLGYVHAHAAYQNARDC